MVEEQIPRPVRSRSVSGFGLFVCLLAGLLLAAPAEGAYPGRNGKIAYTDWDGANSNGSLSWVASIWSNGKGARTHAVGASDPAYSPSGRTLAYADDYDSGIWIRRPEGRRVRRVTRGLDFAPDFAPSGRRIVFVRFTESGSEGEVRIYHAGRTALLTHGDSPAWSARGHAIAFTRTSTDGTHRTGIYTIAPDGRDLRFVTFGSGAGLVDERSHARLCDPRRAPGDDPAERCGLSPTDPQDRLQQARILPRRPVARRGALRERPGGPRHDQPEDASASKRLLPRGRDHRQQDRLAAAAEEEIALVRRPPRGSGRPCGAAGRVGDGVAGPGRLPRSQRPHRLGGVCFCDQSAALITSVSPSGAGLRTLVT